MTLFKCLLFIFLFLVAYVYLGYPAMARGMAWILARKVTKGAIEPQVTVLTAAYNEEECIGETIRNKLALDYPREKLEVIVISDASNDATDEIVRGYESEGVRLLRHETRAGKTSALNLAVPVARGEILIFSDANSIYDRHALRRILENFYDPKVGYVTGKMIYANPGQSAAGDGCGAYIRYENGLREIENFLGSVVGVDGGIDAVRKSLYRPMAPDQIPDLVLPLKVVEQGFRVVYEPAALVRENALNGGDEEYRMRVRVSLRSLWALWEMRHLLIPWKYGVFAWQLISHKVMRYLCFLFLLGAFVCNLMVWNEGLLYTILLVLQCIAYLSAWISWHLEKKGVRVKTLFVPYYFVLVNLAAAHAFLKFVLGRKQPIWTPRKG